MNQQAAAEEAEGAEIDPELAEHLREAQNNRAANAIVTSGVIRS